MKKTIAIIPAAGSGKRLGRKIAKQYVRLAGKPLLVYSLGVLNRSKRISEIIIVAEQSHVHRVKKIVAHFRIRKVRSIVPGGKTRTESVKNGLKVVPADADFVLIHDGVRPFITSRIVDRCIKAAIKYKAVICAVRCTATIKSADKNLNVLSTLNRKLLWQVQTPQVFEHKLIKQAYKKVDNKKGEFFDDASLVEQLSHKVKIVPGLYTNIKITTAEDIKIAEAILEVESRE